MGAQCFWGEVRIPSGKSGKNFFGIVTARNEKRCGMLPRTGHSIGDAQRDSGRHESPRERRGLSYFDGVGDSNYSTTFTRVVSMMVVAPGRPSSYQDQRETLSLNDQGTISY